MKQHRPLVFIGLLLCAGVATGQDSPATFPHISVDVDAQFIEIEGRVPIRLDDPESPRVYLELIACTPNTKEHEVLVVTQAKPSHVHAAILMLGLAPGRPAWWTQEEGKVVAHAPEGDAITVEFIVTDAAGNRTVYTPSDWIKNAQTNEPWPDGVFVFAGSLTRDRGRGEQYEADGAGTIIGLTSFGSEVIAWPEVLNPDSTVDAPEWVANPEHVPAVDMPVTIRIRPAGDD